MSKLRELEQFLLHHFGKTKGADALLNDAQASARNVIMRRIANAQGAKDLGVPMGEKTKAMLQRSNADFNEARRATADADVDQDLLKEVQQRFHGMFE